MTKEATYAEAMESNRVIIFDTTLRDGEQSPGASMNLDEKLRLAEMLANMGDDGIMREVRDEGIATCANFPVPGIDA